MAAAAPLGRARRRSVGPDAFDHDPPHHRHRRDSIALGASARPLSSELRHRLRPPAGRGQSGRRHRSALPPRRRRIRLQRRIRPPFLHGDPGPASAVHHSRRAPCRDVPAAARAGAPHRFLPRHGRRRSARRGVLRHPRSDPFRLGL